MNTCQYTFRIKEEGIRELPAGSVTPLVNGSKPVNHHVILNYAKLHENQKKDQTKIVSDADADNSGLNLNAFNQEKSPFEKLKTKSPVKSSSSSYFLNADSNNQQLLNYDGWYADTQYSFSISGDSTIFPGTKGLFHSTQMKEFSYNSDLHNQLANLSFIDVLRLSYMFNFSVFSKNSLMSIQKRRLVSLQLDESDWSRPFSLDAVGINQTVSIDSFENGVIEVGLKIKMALGRLGKYTKIIRLVPKYIIVNKLDRSIRLLQPVGFIDSKKPITVSGSHIKSFHLPELYGEKKIRLQVVDGLYEKSVAFDVDSVGTISLLLKKTVDLATLHHVNTRGAPEFTVYFPKEVNELGIWFETDWGEQNVVVKSFRAGGYAIKNTDIQIGDVIVAINNEMMHKKPFDLVMLTLKAKLIQGCHVTFRTVEEKIRLIREAAINSQNKSFARRNRDFTLNSTDSMDDDNSGLPSHETLDYTRGRKSMESKDNVEMDMAVRINTRSVEACTIITVNPINLITEAEYRIDNMSVSHIIYFKQKNVPGNKWNTLGPGL